MMCILKSHSRLFTSPDLHRFTADVFVKNRITVHRRFESSQRIVVKWSNQNNHVKGPRPDVHAEYRCLPYESQLKKKAENFKKLIDNVMITLSYEENLAPELKLTQQQAAFEIISAVEAAVPLSSSKLRDIVSYDYLVSGFSQERGDRTVGKYSLSPDDADGEEISSDSSEKSWNAIFINPNCYSDYPEAFEKIGKAFETFLRANPLPIKTINDHHFQQWNWFRIQMRRNKKQETMLIVPFHSQSLSSEDVAKNKEALKSFFRNQSGVDLASLYFQQLSHKHPDLISEGSFELLFGSEVLTNDVAGLDFVYHPAVVYPPVHESFEQVQLALARMLKETKNEVVIQLDAGNGAVLGVLCQGAYQKYYSIERTKFAANNTRANFKLHNIDDSRCRTLSDFSKLYGFMKMITQEHGADAKISLVYNCDNQHLLSYKRKPKNEFLFLLREIPQIKTVLYVSNLRQSVHIERDCFNLMAPKSRSSKLLGSPFVAREAVLVDERPASNHCAVIVRFKRQ